MVQNQQFGKLNAYVQREEVRILWILTCREFSKNVKTAQVLGLVS